MMWEVVEMVTKALGMIETWGLAISIEVADAMLKAANVSLVNQERVDIAHVTVAIEGDLSDVQIAIEAGTRVAKRTGSLIAFDVIPHPEIGTSKLSKKTEINKLYNWRDIKWL